ncbi:MAG: hypothetical protein Q9212_005011 [Teloschistes hypoglaucus]
MSINEEEEKSIATRDGAKAIAISVAISVDEFLRGRIEDVVLVYNGEEVSNVMVPDDQVYFAYFWTRLGMARSCHGGQWLSEHTE